MAVLLSALLAVQRAQGVESAEGTGDALRLSGLDPAGIFLGKAGAVVVQLLALEVLLGVGVVVLYDIDPSGWATRRTAVAATLGLAAAGTLYGALAAEVASARDVAAAAAAAGGGAGAHRRHQGLGGGAGREASTWRRTGSPC